MRSWIPLAGAGLTALLLSGCLLSPQLTQLERMKNNRQKGDLQSNTQETIACESTAAECYQLHLVKGDACAALAVKATEIAARRKLDTCAADDLLAGATLAPQETTPVGDIRGYKLKRLEALRDLIDTRRAGDLSGADTLASAAQDFRKAYASDPAGPFYLASAQLTAAEDTFVVSGDPAALCKSLTGIDGVARAGGAAPGDLQPQYNNLAKSIADLRRTGGCT